MTTLSLENAAMQLPEVVHRLGPGEQVLITEGEQVVARLVGEGTATWQRPKPGLGKGMITVVAEDDDHLKDFADYMP